LWTIDEADDGKIKQFPDLKYLAYTCDVWMKEPLLAIPKSRRMMLTWLMLGLHLWAAIFRPRSAIFVQSKKEADSAFLIGEERMRFMYHHLPPGYPWPAITSKEKPPLIKLSNGSWIMGIGQGADQLRQYTASYIMADEIAFWENPYSVWSAMKPTLLGGGRITMISSANPGFFHEICIGKL
jgi:hypothetical protein